MSSDSTTTIERVPRYESAGRARITTTSYGPNYAGGEVFGAEWKLPGTIVTPNITPHDETGIGGWTDEEVKRAIREGINEKGERPFPLMPSHDFQAMSDEDLEGIVAFLRSLPPTLGRWGVLHYALWRVPEPGPGEKRRPQARKPVPPGG